MDHLKDATPELSPNYIEMREALLATRPDGGATQPTDELPHVFGVVVDVGFEVLFTTAVFADGTTSVYNGNGGGAVGLGEVGQIGMLSRALLGAIEANLAAFEPIEATPLPPFGRVHFTAITYDGRLGVEVDGGSLVKGQHALTKPFAAVMAIMDAARRVGAQQAQSVDTAQG
jgi:hypothetical protein